MGNVEDKVVMITGASRGLGAALAEVCAAAAPALRSAREIRTPSGRCAVASYEWGEQPESVKAPVRWLLCCAGWRAPIGNGVGTEICGRRLAR
ncbi:MAG: hypothetical protein GEU90_03540 [Gemmatimonas sp.]|nr:hypothetical protein [Gemmatimonas sp.]